MMERRGVPHFGQTGSPLVSAQRTALNVTSASRAHVARGSYTGPSLVMGGLHSAQNRW